MSRQVVFLGVFLTALVLGSFLSVKIAPADPGALRERSAQQPPAKPHVPDEVIIKFKGNASNSEKEQIRSELGGTKLKGFGRIKAEHRRLDALTVDEAISRYKNHPKVEYIEPNYILEASDIPNDPMFDQLWGMQNTGQTGGTADADISATNAWDVFTGSDAVVIGVIDTGTDYLHPDLAANIYSNPGEIAGNGIDDDANGFIDDVRGWDFVNNDNDPMDDAGHGTHVAGTIGAVGDNAIGVAGVNWTVKILPIKFLNAGGSGTTANAIASVEYATLMGVHLTNNSWGGGGFSLGLQDAIADAGANGILFVAASGNGSANTDLFPHYPSSFDLENIVSVAATDHNDALASFSNFGIVTVDIAAPGVNILSSLPGGGYGPNNGTSMACPHVAGALGLVFGKFPSIGYLDAKALVLGTADPLPNLSTVVLTGARLNAFMAIADPDSTAPSPISDLAVGTQGSNWLMGNWTATGDDGEVGTASRYVMKYSTSPITEANFDSAMTAPDPPDPGASGTAEVMQVNGLEFTTTYYLAVKALDEFGNASPISNVAVGTTLGPPTADVDPALLTESLVVGSTSTQILTLSNLGEGTLDFVIPRPDLVTAPPSIAAYEMVPKGGVDPRAGNPVTLGAGGPDGFGYRWTDSDEPFGPVFDWTDISGSGTVAISSADDSNVGPFPIGFTFPYYASEFDAVRICSNGFLSFTSTSPEYTNQPLPNPSAPVNMIAPFWDDLLVSAGNVYYYNDGTRFVVQWDNVGHYNGGGPYTFQAILYPDGKMEFQYLSMGAPSDGATVGIQNGSGTDALQVAFNTAYIHDNLAIRMQAVPQWLTVSPGEGTVFASGDTELSVNFDPADLLGGTYEANVRILSNDPVNPQVTVPVILTVIGAPDISVTPASFDFGQVFLGAAPTTVFLVDNPGTDTLHVSDISISDAAYSPDTSVFSVPPRAGRSVTVTYAPTGLGPNPATMTITSNDPDSPSETISLNGEAVAPPDIDISPVSFTEDLFTGETSTQILSIANTGVADLEWQTGVQTLSTASFTLTVPGVSSISVDDVEAPAAPAPRTTAIVADLADLTGTDILWDRSHGQFTAEGWATIIADLTLRGATFTENFDPITPALLTQYEILWTADSDPWSGAEIDALKNWVLNGGGFIVESDQRVASIDALLSAMGAGIEYATGSGTSGPTSNIFPHETTQGVSSVFISNPLAHLLPTIVPGGDLVNDASGVLNTAFSTPGSGHVVVIADEIFSDPTLGLEDNQLFANQVIDWLVRPTFMMPSPSSGTVASGDTDTVNVLFDASGLFGGDYFADIEITSNDPDEPEIIVPTALHVTGAPDITLSDAALDFGPVFIGDSSVRILTVANAGTDDLIVSTVGVDHPDYSVNATNFTLSPGGTEDLQVTLAPTSAAPLPATLSLVSNDPDTPTAAVALVGEGLVAPVAGVSPTSLNEALFTGETSTQTLTIQNTGGNDLEFDLSTEVVSGATSMSVEDAVASIVERSGILEGPIQSATTSVISGEEVIQTLVDPGDIASVEYATSASELNVALVAADQINSLNDVRAKLLATGRFNTVTIIEATFVTPTLSELQAFDGVMVHSSRPYADQVTLGNNLADYVDAGGGVVSAMFEVAVEPISFPLLTLKGRWETGEYNVVTRSPHQGWASQSLGTVHDPTHPTMVGVTSFDGGSGSFRPTTSVLTSGSTLIAEWTDGAPLVAVKEIGGANRVDLCFYPPSSDVSSNFWQVGTDGDILMANALEWAISGASWLSMEPESGVVAPGASLDVDVLFDATGLYGGLYEASILVSSNDPLSPLTVPVQLDVTGAPDLTLSDSDLAFGSVFIGDSEGRILTVSNSGTDDLVVSSISTDEPEYTVDMTGFTLLPEETQDILVVLSPTSVGPIPATLSIASNDPDMPLATVALTGEGVEPPDVFVSPTLLTEDLLSGETSIQTLTVGNAGLGPLDFLVDVVPQLPAGAVSVPFAGLSAGDPNASTNPPSEGAAGPSSTEYSEVDGDFLALSPSPVPLTCIVGDPAFGYLYGQADRGTTFHRYQVSTDTWEQLTSSPIHSGNNGGAVLLNGKVYTVYTSGNSMGIYDIATDTWDTVSGPLGTGNIATDGVDLYLVVGTAFVRVDPGTFSTTDLSSPPFPFRQWGGLRHLNGVLYGHEGNGTSGFAGYDIASDTWTSLPSLPAGAVLGAAIDPFNQTYYAYGSYGGNSLYAYSIAENAWSVLTVPFFSLNDGGMAWFPTLTGLYFVQGESGTGFTRYITPSSFLSVDPTSGVVSAGGSLDLDVLFDATSRFGGDYFANIIISSNDPDESEVVVPTTLHVTGVPDIAVSETLLEFGDVFLGYDADLTLVISNNGTDELIVSSVGADVGDYSVDTPAFTLPISSSLEVTVSFAPTSAGAIPATLSIVSNDPDTPTATVTLLGAGLVPPLANLSPDSLESNLFTNETETQLAILANAGGSDLEFTIDTALLSSNPPPPPPPPPPSPGGPKIAVHTQAHAVKSGLICTSAAPTIPCSDYSVESSTLSGQDVYVVVGGVGGAGTNGVAGVSFGIEYDNLPGSGVDLINWSLCADGLQFPSDTWPDSESGTRITWVTCQNTEIPPDGIHAIAGAFYVYAYDSDQFAITENNTIISGPELVYSNCVGAIFDIPPTAVGSVGFSSGLTFPGFNPCENAVQVHEGMDLAKGEEDPRVGSPVIQDHGGPDAYGYTWIDSDDPGGPVFNWVDISGVGTPVPVTGEEANSGFLPIGFSFPFYGNYFSEFSVSTNGWISFSSTAVYPNNQPLPTNLGPGNLLAVFWDDLEFPSQQAYYHFDGTRLIVQFQDVIREFTGGAYTFQVILTPSGTILYQYLSMDGVVNRATVGIQNEDRNDGLGVVFNASYLHDELAIRIGVSPDWLSVNPMTGVVPAGGSLSLDVTTDATAMFGGEYLADILVTTNDPLHPLLTLPVALNVTGIPDLAVSPAELIFGEVWIGYPETLELLVTNTGTEELDVSSIVPGIPEYSISPSGFILQPFESEYITVTLDPLSAGDKNTQLTLTSNDPDSPELVEMVASAAYPPQIAVTPDTLEAAALPGGLKTKTLTVCNTGGADLSFSLDSFGAPPPVPPGGPRVAVHSKSHATKAALICRAADEGGEAPTDIPCSDYVTEALTGVGQDVYVTAVTPDSTGIAALSFGIEYNGVDGQGVDVFSWNSCVTGLEFPSDTWPASGSGIRTVYLLPDHCQEDFLPPDGIHAVFGAFYVYAYSLDAFTITENRTLFSGPEFSYANCGGAEIPIPVTAAGSVSFSELANVPGFNPCVTGVTVYSGPELEKGAEDNRVGTPVSQGTGGPDLFGYHWVDSDEPGGPVFNWFDISTLGIGVPASGDDDNSGFIDIGFPFPYYGQVYDRFAVCTNGFLSFSSTSTQHSNSALPSIIAPQDMLAVFWDDLYCSSGSIRYYNQGDQLIVQFTEVTLWGESDPLTFQVILQPSGKIVYQYLSMSGVLTGATVGIQNQTRNDGLTVAFNTPYLHDELAIRLLSETSWLDVTPISGLIPPGQCQELTVTLDAADLIQDDYVGSIGISSNDPVTREFTTEVIFHVGSVDAAEFNADPNTLNLGSNGRFVTANVELPMEYASEDVLLVTVLLNATVPADPEHSVIGDFNENGTPDWTFKFDRVAVEAILDEGDSVAVVVTGEIEDTIYFTGTEYIRAIRPQLQSPNGSEMLLSGTFVEVFWDNPNGWAVTSAAITYSADAGATWSLAAEDIVGESYVWRVPAEPTEEAMLRLYVYDADGILGHDTSDGVFTVNTSVTTAQAVIPTVHALLQNSPNPFSSSSRITFDLPVESQVELRIYDVEGRMLRALHDGWMPAGRHEAVWDGKDTGGRQVASGIYFYRLEAGDYVASKRMLLSR